MQTVYYLRTDELDNQFLEALKTLFKDKMIEIVVTEADETAYLLHSNANREHLLQAIEHVDNGENLVEVALDTLSTFGASFKGYFGLKLVKISTLRLNRIIAWRNILQNIALAEDYSARLLNRLIIESF